MVYACYILAIYTRGYVGAPVVIIHMNITVNFTAITIAIDIAIAIAIAITITITITINIKWWSPRYNTLLIALRKRFGFFANKRIAFY